MGTHEAEALSEQLLSKVEEQQKTWELRQQIQTSGPHELLPEKWQSCVSVALRAS